MWAEAAKHLRKYSEGVVSAVDAGGYPLSVRQTSHFHDERLWNLRAILLKGRLERRDGAWVFQTTDFMPPASWKALLQMRKSARDYLAKRDLPRPTVNWASIEAMWRDAKQIKDP